MSYTLDVIPVNLLHQVFQLRRGSAKHRNAHMMCTWQVLYGAISAPFCHKDPQRSLFPLSVNVRNRLSLALGRFRSSCSNQRRKRRLKLALGIVCDLSQRRPMSRKWIHWQGLVDAAKARARFAGWAIVARRQHRSKCLSQKVATRRDAATAKVHWRAWRRASGASTLAGLLRAWAVIGPVREALGALRLASLDERADKHIRRRCLRCVR